MTPMTLKLISPDLAFINFRVLKLFFRSEIHTRRKVGDQKGGPERQLFHSGIASYSAIIYSNL